MNIEHGHCHCGCGEKTNLAPQTDPKKGWVRGEPKKYLLGHNRRKSATKWLSVEGPMPTPCWVWQRALSRGYAVRRSAADGMVRVHRENYEKANGPIPMGLHLDHLCRNPACVNPAHLEAVTSAENQRRGDNTKLTRDEVASLRQGEMTPEDLAATHGMNLTYLKNVQARRIPVWLDV